jgi:hypothetical protein
MRQRIRNERRVELSFEEHRFLISGGGVLQKEVLNGPVYGMKNNKTGGNTFTYQKALLLKTGYSLTKWSCCLFPQAEIDKNPAAKQIAGW